MCSFKRHTWEFPNTAFILFSPPLPLLFSSLPPPLLPLLLHSSITPPPKSPHTRREESLRMKTQWPLTSQEEGKLNLSAPPSLIFLYVPELWGINIYCVSYPNLWHLKIVGCVSPVVLADSLYWMTQFIYNLYQIYLSIYHHLPPFQALSPSLILFHLHIIYTHRSSYPISPAAFLMIHLWGKNL